LIDASTAISALAALSSLAAAAGVIRATIGKARADRNLRKMLDENEVQLRMLEAFKNDLGKNPDPIKVEEARRIIDSLTQKMSQSDRSEILKTLDRVSDQSRANYISKLIEDAE
jgi:hypothetical protein